MDSVLRDEIKALLGSTIRIEVNEDQAKKAFGYLAQITDSQPDHVFATLLYMIVLYAKNAKIIDDYGDTSHDYES